MPILGLKLVNRTLRQAKPYWFSKDKTRARLLLAALLLLLVGDTVTSVFFNQQSGEFTSALAARNGPRFWRSIAEFFGLLIIGVPIYAYYYYVRDTLALSWRRWLTQHFLGKYFDNRGYYRLLTKPDIDNPDQRISDDIYSFTSKTLTFLLIFTSGLFQLVAFGGVLWRISGRLLLFVFLYAAGVTALSFGIFGEKMVSLYSTQRKREADFRYSLVRIRENAEPIALYQGETLEQGQVQKLFGKVFANATDLIRWSLRLNFLYYGNSFLAMVLPTLIIAPRVLSGELEVGAIVQATGAFSSILSALTLLLDNLDDLSRYAASVGRLETLSNALAPEKARRTPSKRGPEKILTEESEHLEFSGVTLKTPTNDRTLIKDLTLTIAPGKGLMVVGASGLGKSSLLRAIAGLWDVGEGILHRPKAEDLLFLPQYAYMAVGNLRLQLNYPNLGRSVSEEELREMLNMVNLADLPERCGGFDNEFDFEKILSAGERQRLAFARVLLKHPRYVLLDEATSALDRENEAALYSKLIETDTTLVSVSHHPALVRYHSQVLELKPGGEWILHPAGKFRFHEDLV